MNTQCTATGTGPLSEGFHSSGQPGSFFLDVSIDGIVNLAGNAQEWTADVLESYGVGCWAGTAVLVDPSCPDGSSGVSAVRGGNWDGESGSLPVGLRTWAPLGFGPGFRCVRSAP
jgi:formylglycine-generating enzyme required for sulfatase activity